MEQKSKRSMPKWLKITGTVIVWIFVVLAALMTVLALSSQKNSYGVSSVCGKMPITVLSSSMSPTFNQWDLIVDSELTSEEKANLSVGDVVTFYADLKPDDGISEESLNTHRIVSVRDEDGYRFYKTKGDNNEIADTYEIRYDQVVGRWSKDGKDGFKLPGLGGAIYFLQQPKGFLFCIVIPLILFFLYEVYRFVVVIVSMKSKKLAAETEEEIKRRAVEEYLKSKEDKDDDNKGE